MVGSVSGNTAVGASPLSVAGDKVLSGLKAIGNAFVKFGGMIAGAFASLGQAIARAGNNAQGAGGAQAGHGATFTAEEKSAHMDAALNGAFYGSLAGSTTSVLTEALFRSTAASILTTPEAVASMKAHGIDLDEAVAISIYTGGSFYAINDGLRNNTTNPEINALRDAFVSGLAKLPSFAGNEIQTPGGARYECFRGAKLPDNVGPNYTRNAQVADPGIMSSSNDRTQAFTKVTGVNYDMTLLLKPGSAGKDISAFSEKPWECEVAFPPGVQFTVIARHFESYGMLPANLEETYHPSTTGSGHGLVQLTMVEV